MGVVIDASTEEGQRELIQFSAQVKGLQELRKPFPPERIEKRPQPKWKKAWENQPSQNCSECGGYHPVGHFTIHLDYVGHANATDRLLEVDPWWNWEPMAYTEAGTPLFTDNGLWIRLTVCGVTRIGFGDGSSVKEVIGDAIRNAAMRFGLALDLWSRIDLHEALNRQAPTGQGRAGDVATGSRGRNAQRDQVATPAAPRAENQDALDALKSVCDEHGYATQYCIDRFYSDYDIHIKDAASELILVFADTLIAEATAEPGEGDAAAGEGDGPGGGESQAGATEGEGEGAGGSDTATQAETSGDPSAERDGAGNADGGAEGIKF